MITDSDLREALGAFAAAGIWMDPRILDAIIGTYAREMVAEFLTVHGEMLGETSPGLREAMEDGCRRGMSFDIAWDIALGNLAIACGRPPGAGPQRAAVEFALRLPNKGSWQSEFVEPMCLHVGAEYLIGVRRLSVTCGKRTVGQWTAPGHFSDEGCCEGLEQIACGSSGGGITVLVGDAVKHPALFTADLASGEANWELMRTTPSSFQSVLGDAIALIGEYAPDYLTWVARVVRYLVPVTTVKGCDLSSSSRSQPSVVYASATQNVPALAEMLVHEATHQFFNILSRAGKFDNGSDTSLYYSPLKGVGRPIHAILVAYHAVGNIFLWTMESLSSGICDAYFTRNADELPAALEILETALTTTRALTPLGEAIWRPLSTRIHALT